MTYLLKKILAYVRRYWYVCVSLVAGIVFLAISKRTPKKKLEKTLVKHIDDANIELHQIEQSHQEEIRKNHEIEERFEKNIEQVGIKYYDDNKKLDHQTEADVHDITEQFIDDPDKMAKELADKYGLEFVETK